ncbi:MAG: hypothetical protein RLZZ227_15 [Pseudomonadota bacterium]
MRKTLLATFTRSTTAVLAAAALSCLVAGPALGHHSFSAEFDAAKSGELSGVITEVRFSNPHVRYRVDVKMPDGSTENWEIQAGSVTSLRPQGWLADSIKVGDAVSVQGELGRDDAKKIFVRGITLADGRRFGGTEGNNTAAARAAASRNTVNADPARDYGYGQQNAAAPFDISGPWRQGYKFRVTVDDLEPKPTPFTPQGEALRAANEKYDDPALRCISLGLPRLFGNPYNIDIHDAGSHYLFTYVEHNSPRRVWMDGRTPPADTVPTSNGYSVGHWEDADTLVIETTHLLPGWLDGSGLPMNGEGTRTVERIDFTADHLSADRTMTIHDPLYTQPLVRTRGWARDDIVDVSEQDSCDPASYYTDLQAAGLLEEYLQP